VDDATWKRRGFKDIFLRAQAIIQRIKITTIDENVFGIFKISLMVKLYG